MNIAVYHNLPSGGAKRTLYETLARLAPRHSVHVFTLTTADERFCDVRPVVRSWRAYRFVPSPLFSSPLGRLNQLQRWRDLWRLDALQRQVAAEIDRGGFDVVLVQPCMWTQAPLVLRHLRTPSVYYCHELPRALYETRPRPIGGARRMADRLDPLITLYRGTARRLDREAARAARTLLVNSEFTRAAVGRAYGLSPVVSYHGVDAEAFRPHPEITGQGYVLSVGSIQPHKGFDFVIDSLALLPFETRPELHLVGNAPLSHEREALTTQARRQQVTLHIETDVNDAILLRRYNEAALLAYAPHGEPFGLAPLEAMACARPVVAVSEGGVAESVVHERTGLLVDRDAHRFAAAIQRVLGDNAAREAYGRQARDYVLERWTWNAAVGRMETHLQDAAQGGQQRGRFAVPLLEPRAQDSAAAPRHAASS